MKRSFKLLTALSVCGLLAGACTGSSDKTYDEIVDEILKAATGSGTGEPNTAPTPDPGFPAPGPEINSNNSGGPPPPPPPPPPPDAGPDVTVGDSGSDSGGDGGTCPGQFTCANTNCVPTSWVCDNFNDCGDNSDEVGCNSCGTDGGSVNLELFVTSDPLSGVTDYIYLFSATAYRYPLGVQTPVALPSAVNLNSPTVAPVSVGGMPCDTEVLNLYGYMYDNTLADYYYFDITVFGDLTNNGPALANISSSNNQSYTHRQSIGLGDFSGTGDNNEIFHATSLTPSTDYPVIRALDPNTPNASFAPYTGLAVAFPTTDGTLQISTN